MAKPINFENQNSVASDEKAVPLYRDGAQNVSCHALTPTEMMEVMNTGRIWLITPGSVYPNSTISGHYPFDKKVQ